MSPSHVLEPTCRKLKRMLMEGVWPPGTRLEALKLADDLGVSMTPVRDCLNRLVGERLVEMKPGEGYRVPHIGEKGLRDMLSINFALIQMGLGSQPANIEAMGVLGGAESYADRTAELFRVIAAWADNHLVSEIVEALNVRLHSIRLREPLLFLDAPREIAIAEKCMVERRRGLHAIMHYYHARRLKNVSDLIELLA